MNKLHGFPNRMAIIDCETTGGKATRDRIIELAIILVDDGQVVSQWQSLLNPKTSIPPWITHLTGIDNAMVLEQPTFSEVWPKITAMLEGRVLVAHNARFDYGFLRNEAKRIGDVFKTKTLCSVKLSRKFYPQFKRHSLDSVIKRLNCRVENRHRALDDALVIVKLFSSVASSFDEAFIRATIDSLLKRPSLPSHLDESEVNKLPECPGVYYFYNEKGRLLYIGKSVNLKTRVLSHFYQDHRYAVDHHLSHQLHHIDFATTPTDFGAQILESQQIKKCKPSLNKRLKKVSKLYRLQLEKQQGYLTAKIEMVEDVMDSNETYGLFRSRRQAIKTLEKLADSHFLCHRLMGLEKKTSGACFAFQLKKCMGACCAKEPAESYNLRLLKALSQFKKQQWPYSSAVVVEERNQVTSAQKFHLINHWCYLGEIKSADDLWGWTPLFESKDDILLQHNVEGLFDLDIYFILIKFLLNEDLCQREGILIHPIETFNVSFDDN